MTYELRCAIGRWMLAGALAVAGSNAVLAQEVGEPAETADALPAAAEPGGSDDDWHALEKDPCSIDVEGNWIDWMNRRVTRSVCGSARWFDNFFGTARGDEERQATFGRLGLGALWDEDDGVEADLRFRAKVHFPNMEDRLTAVVGRGNTDEILSQEGPTVPPDDLFFDDETDWLLGLGYNIARSDRNRLSLDLGTSFSNSAFDPYVRLRYIYNRPVFKQSHLRWRLVPQWQETRGAGVTSLLTIDRSFGDRLLFRWDLSFRDFEKRFDGLAYGSSVQLFHHIGVGRAMRYVLGIWGQTGFLHDPEDWGLQVVFRDSIYKELLFIEVLGGVNLRRRDEDLEREAKYLAGLLFELKFGR